MFLFRYYWTKNGDKFEFGARITMWRKGNLVFSNPDSDDEGIYQCFAENVGGIAASVKVDVRKACKSGFP